MDRMLGDHGRQDARRKVLPSTICTPYAQLPLLVWAARECGILERRCDRHTLLHSLLTTRRGYDVTRIRCRERGLCYCLGAQLS